MPLLETAEKAPVFRKNALSLLCILFFRCRRQALQDFLKNEEDYPKEALRKEVPPSASLSKNPCFHAVKAGVLLQFVEK